MLTKQPACAEVEVPTDRASLFISEFHGKNWTPRPGPRPDFTNDCRLADLSLHIRMLHVQAQFVCQSRVYRDRMGSRLVGALIPSTMGRFKGLRPAWE